LARYPADSPADKSSHTSKVMLASQKPVSEDLADYQVANELTIAMLKQFAPKVWMPPSPRNSA